MSFLEWRRFTFFDLKRNVDRGAINRALGGTNVTATTCGHGSLVICDSEGVIHLVNRNFQVTTFQGYLLTISLAVQLKSAPILITIGADDLSDNALIKMWDLEKQDRQGNPVNLKTIKALPNSNVPASAVCVSDSTNMMAVGFANGVIILFRGNITRDRTLKQKILRDGSDPVTGLAFKTTGKSVHLFVATIEAVLQYNVTVKDKEDMVQLDDEEGCALGCSILADSIQDYPFMVARKNGIYCYTVDGRGPCYAVGGPKVRLQWFRTYLIIVAEDKDSTLATPVRVSSTNDEETSNAEKEAHVITVLDVQNKFTVYSSIFPEVLAVLPEWGSFYILGKDRNLYHLLEKDLRSKLDLLFKKNLYDISIRIAKNQQYDSDSMIDIFRLYGDHLYKKGDHNGAIDQYIKTIGKLEPSYVIRKFLDSHHIDNLIKYLSALHKQGVATGDHTTLLLNCYTKLNNFQKLKEFLFAKDRDIDFDIDIAISVCRKSSSEDALMLAEKYGLHLWYVKILLEDHKKYSSALQYVAKLEFTDAYDLAVKFGDTFIQHIPDEFTQFLKKLCTNYYPSETLLLDQNEQQTTYQADPIDFIHLFLNNSSKMVEFLEYLTQHSNKWDISIYNTLIDHYLHLWSNSNDATVKLYFEQKIMSTLQSLDLNYDKNQALIFCSTRNFKPGILYLLEENKLYHQILRYQLNNGNYEDVLACCRRFGYLEPSLWIKSLFSAATDPSFPPSILCEILAVIEKENLMSPLQVIDVVSRSKTLTVEDILSYLSSILKSESKIIEEENALIEKYKWETKRIKKHVEHVRNNPVIFQGSLCSACRSHLELPSVHFLCHHSFHQYCCQSYSENENECPACSPNNAKILGVIKSQEQSRDLHESFHRQLERANDSFSLIADYFGRNLFSKISVNTEFAKQFHEPLMKYNARKKQESILETQREPTRDNRLTVTPMENRESEVARSLEANIEPLKEPQVIATEDDSLSNAIVNKSSTSTGNVSTNPFEGDDNYDESRNPFFNDDELDTDDGYDSTKNPFADADDGYDSTKNPFAE